MPPEPADSISLPEVAVHAADWDSSPINQMLRHTLSACAARKLEPKVFYARQSSVVLSQEGEVWDRREIMGAILITVPTDQAQELTRLYHNANKPVVSVDNPVEGAHFVGTDNLATVKLGLDHLTALGHKRICLLINEPEDHENVRLRKKYFQAECKRRRLKGCSVVHCGTKFWENSYDKAYEKMPEVMAQNPRPTAIFAFADPGAWAALKWCAKEGLEVPRDLSVLGFANDKPSAFTYPALTTIAHPIPEMAVTAVDLLSIPLTTPETRWLEPTLIVRESTGPCKRTKKAAAVPE